MFNSYISSLFMALISNNPSASRHSKTKHCYFSPWPDKQCTSLMQSFRTQGITLHVALNTRLLTGYNQHLLQRCQLRAIQGKQTKHINVSWPVLRFRAAAVSTCKMLIWPGECHTAGMQMSLLNDCPANKTTSETWDLKKKKNPFYSCGSLCGQCGHQIVKPLKLY